MSSKPSCFISYAWEDSAHEAWILGLATKLKESGVDVHIDKWDTRLGDDLAHYMETSVRESDFVVIVCTPSYAQKSNEGTGGAGYEKQVVTGELLYGKNPSKFIPLIRKGPVVDALPSFLKPRKYIDFRDDSKFQARFTELLDHLRTSQSHGTQRGGFTIVRTAPQVTVPSKAAPREIALPPPLDFILGKPTTSTGKSTSQNAGKSMVYCSRCGIQPGTQTECIGLATAHDFVRDIGVIYCECCGQLAGSKTGCLRLLGGGHTFKSGSGDEVCSKCGLKVGTKKSCTGFAVCHAFKAF